MDVSKEELKRLTEIHIERYTDLLSRHHSGDTSVRPDECKRYLKIWSGIAACGYDVDKLTYEMRHEVIDALEAGE